MSQTNWPPGFKPSEDEGELPKVFPRTLLLISTFFALAAIVFTFAAFYSRPWLYGISAILSLAVSGYTLYAMHKSEKALRGHQDTFLP